MGNEIQPGNPNPLIMGFCGFCYFVRGREGKTSPHACTGAGGNVPIHKNKNNKNIYINKIAGGSVAPGGIS